MGVERETHMAKKVRNDSERAVQRARTLRSEMAKCEQELWRVLRKSNIGFRFRRQYPAGPFVLDFYCPEARVAVEVDGDPHNLRQKRDATRDAWLLQHDVVCVRVASLEVLSNRDGVLEAIRRVCADRVSVLE